MLHTFKIITTEANAMVKPVSSRMPLVLPQDKEDIWLNKNTTEDEIAQLFSTYSSENYDLLLGVS